MKKFYPLLAFLLIAGIAGLYGLDYYRDLRERQREQTAHLLARCVNQGLLSLFTLQANDWQKRPDFYQQQAQKLEQATAALQEQLVEGRPFAEWQVATKICRELAENSNLQHRTIFRPLGQFAAHEMSDIRTVKDQEALARRGRNIYRLKVSAQAADRYLQDLRSDIHNLLKSADLSAETRERAQAEIDAQVLDHYQAGGFALNRVNTYLDRVQSYFQLLADRPNGYTLRGGSLFFYDRDLRREIDNLNSAIVTGEADFYGNWQQIVRRKN